MRYTPFVLLLAMLVASCAGPRTLTPAEYQVRIPALEAEVGRHPADPDALATLGEAYVQTGQYERGEAVLQDARRLRSDDARAIYYLGLANEGLGRAEEAARLYANYAAIPRTDPFRGLLAGRHAWLQRELLRAEFAALLAAEDSTTAEPTEAIAVFPLAYRGENPRYAPLGRGLSEMLTVDLAAIGRLQIVERLRLQTLLDELELSQGAAFDAATAPKVGRLLRSGRVVGGSVDVRGGDIQTSVALWDWDREQLPDLTERSADLDDLFRLQNEIAFALFEDLGLELTAEERDRIEEIPTRDLQAFLAYSRGLEAEDAGDFGAAAVHFGEAARLDPGFDAATEKATIAEGLTTASGGMEAGLSAGRKARAARGQRAASDLVDGRLTQLNESIGGAVVPGDGDEGREPAAESAVVVEPTAPDPIPDPPLPSGN